MSQVPLLDLKAEYLSIKTEIDAAIADVLESTRFIMGENVDNFEDEFAAFCNAPYAVGVGSGTDALVLALMALDIGPGDEVITTPMTFIATAEAISVCGATPVFVDVDPATHNINPALIEEAITSHTKAIMPVHLHGQMADMDPILEIAKQHNLYVIEDAAQAQGAKYKGQMAGTIGDIACFSFYPGKNIGAYGDAGAIATINEDLAERIKKLRDHGRQEKYVHEIVGVNARIDALQAAVLRVKLRHLAEWNNTRCEVATHYQEHLSKTDIPLLHIPEWSEPVWHHFTVELNNRDTIKKQLKAVGIGTGIHYPLPLHLQPAYSHLGHKTGDFPVAEHVANTTLSLPIYPFMEQSQLETVVDNLLQVTQANG